MVRTIKLNTGRSIPALGWGNGTGGIDDSPEKAISTGVVALKAGILHIDTAQNYFTERETGEAIKQSGIAREKVWVTTKLSQEGSEVKSNPEDIRRSVKQSIDKIGFIPDLLLIHSPYDAEPGKLQLFWQSLEGLVQDGTLKDCALGVSNFRPQDMREVLEVAKIIPAVNQIEYHPFLLAQLDGLMKIQEEHRIVTQAWGPLTPLLRHPSKGGPLKPVLAKIAERLSNDSGQSVDSAGVLLLWTMQKGVCAITTSGNPENVKKMVALNDLPDLTQEEMDEIETVGRKIHYRNAPFHMGKDFPKPDLPQDL